VSLFSRLGDPLDLSGIEARETADDINRQNERARAEAEALNRERYGIATDLLSPYIEDSRTAQNQLMVELGLAEGEAGTAYMDTGGYRTMLDETRRGVDQASANSGSLYSGRRIEAAGEASGQIQQSFYNNYMSILQNQANPTAATNLASLGVNQGISIAGQNLQSQSQQSALLTQQQSDTQAQQADIATMIAGFFTGGAAGAAGSGAATSGGSAGMFDPGGQAFI